MYKHVWAVLCRESKIDAESQNISLHDVVEGINIDPTHENAPEGLKEAIDRGDRINLQLKLELVSFITNDSPEKASTLQLEIDIFDPDGQPLGNVSPKIEFKEGISRMKNRARFNALPITTGGTYTFAVSMPTKAGKEPETVAEVPLFVDIKN